MLFSKLSKKPIFIIAAVFALVVIVFLAIISRAPETKIPEDLKLKASKDKILSMEKAEETVCVENGNCESNAIAKYLYVSKNEVPPATLNDIPENIAMRTKNAQFFENGAETTARFYPGSPFYQNPADGKWYRVEFATTTIEAFEAQTKVSFFEKLLGKKALATDYYTGAGDGFIAKVDSNDWDTAHDALSGAVVNYTQLSSATTMNGRAGGSPYNYLLRRGFYPINTSAMPANAVISSSSLTVFAGTQGNGTNDVYDYVVLVQTSQPNSAALTGDDYDLCGDTINPPAEGSGHLDVTNVASSTWQTIDLNAIGRGWIKKSGQTSNCGTTAGVTCLGARMGNDVEDVPYGGSSGTFNSFVHWMSEGPIAYAPYLSVTYYIHKTQINTPETNFMTNGLVGYWSFNGQDIDNSKNLAYDRSGQSPANNGTMTNMATSSRAVPGISGQALSFDYGGVADYVLLPKNMIAGLSAITVSAWVKPEVADLPSDRIIIDQSDGTPDSIRLIKRAADTYRCIINNDAQTVVNVDSAVFRDTNWHHVVCTYNGAEVDLFVDGNIVVSSNPLTGVIETTPMDNLTISDTYTGVNEWDGLIDEVRLYNRALSASEITDLYRAGAARLTVNTPTTNYLTSGLVGNWTFNGQDISGTTAYDRSGTVPANNGTIYGAKPAIGQVGQALSFDGTDDYVNLGDSTILDGATAYTMSAWVKFDTRTGNILRKWVIPQTSFLFAVNGTDEMSMTAGGSNGGVLNIMTTDLNLNVNQWYFLTAVWSGGNNGQIYANGVPATMALTTATGPDNISNSSEYLTIGARYNSGSPDLFLDGLIDEVRVYNRALSASEILELYQQGTRTTKFKQ